MREALYSIDRDHAYSGGGPSSGGLFVLRFSHPDWVAMQTRQAGLEGTGEIRAAGAREAGPADASVALVTGRFVAGPSVLAANARPP